LIRSRFVRVLGAAELGYRARDNFIQIDHLTRTTSALVRHPSPEGGISGLRAEFGLRLARELRRNAALSATARSASTLRSTSIEAFSGGANASSAGLWIARHQRGLCASTHDVLGIHARPEEGLDRGRSKVLADLAVADKARVRQAREQGEGQTRRVIPENPSFPGRVAHSAEVVESDDSIWKSCLERGSRVQQAQGRERSRGIKARYLGKSGVLSEARKELAKLPPDERRDAGTRFNEAKDKIEAALAPAARRWVPPSSIAGSRKRRWT